MSALQGFDDDFTVLLGRDVAPLSSRSEAALRGFTEQVRRFAG